MEVGKVWDDREFHVHSDYVFSFVINCLCIQNKFEKRTICNFFSESVYEGVFNMLEFIFKEQIQLKTYVYKFVENSTDYPNIQSATKI
jgi:hypothetical protein